ncbi:MAG TPA: hypothetical protein PK406_14585 [Verrucomicrobiota bacterium]|nr:hypothetical protein [Verrucomicrobiota bacterium]
MQNLTYAQRQTAARQEFARWRKQNPRFTSKELLDAWGRIRRAWMNHERSPLAGALRNEDHGE